MSNDTWIREQLRAQACWPINKVKGVNYNVVVYDGAVYLLGLAQSEDELRRAAETASTVRGVTKVVSYVKMRDRRAAPIAGAARRPMTTAAAIGQPADIQAASASEHDLGTTPPAPNAPSSDRKPPACRRRPPRQAPAPPATRSVSRRSRMRAPTSTRGAVLFRPLRQEPARPAVKLAEVGRRSFRLGLTLMASSFDRRRMGSKYGARQDYISTALILSLSKDEVARRTLPDCALPYRAPMSEASTPETDPCRCASPSRWTRWKR